MDLVGFRWFCSSTITSSIEQPHVPPFKSLDSKQPRLNTDRMSFVWLRSCLLNLLSWISTIPNPDGLRVCSDIHSDSSTAHIPVLFVAERLDRTSFASAFDCGATELLIKPLDFAQLPYSVQFLLRRSHTEQKLRLLLHKSQEASQAKSEFLANMSHELRTPLNAIMGFSEFMSMEAFDPFVKTRYREYAEGIHESAAHLLQVINDILDISKVESGRLSQTPARFQLQDTVEKVVRLVRGRADEMGQTIDVVLDPALPELFADETRLSQILINLLSNAIKFTPATGQVVFEAKAISEETIQMVVEDTGVGIAPDKIEHALTAFEQVERDVKSRFEGTGLGLPLARALTELMGGHLSLESRIGMGTSVTLTFPRARIVSDIV